VRSIFRPLSLIQFQIAGDTLITYKHNWGQDRVYYHDETGKLCSVPASWTSVPGEDPFVVMANGRSPFRLVDLLELARLVDEIASRPTRSGQRAGEKKM
jgi:hypothetical protein